MAEPTHEASQPLTEIGVDFTQLLPPELLSQIMTYRAAHRVDLKSMALTCKNLYAAAFALLFETATIAVSLTDEIASVGQAWRPLRWETPAFLTHLLHSAHLRVQIRNVRIIVQPWPTGIWTNERFASQKARLKEKRDEAINVLGRIPQQHMHQPNLDANPRGQDSRQLFIIDAYYSLFHSHCADRDGRHRADWTEDSDLLLQPLLRQLPNLRHVETGPVIGPVTGPAIGPWLWPVNNVRYLWNMATVYTDRLILRMALRNVKSISAQGLPYGTVGDNDYSYPDYQDANIAARSTIDQRLASYVARAPHLSTLLVNESATYYYIDHNTPIAFLWRNALRRLHNLTTFTLSQTHSIMAIDEVTSARSGRLPKLEALLADVVLPSIQNLKLSHWAVLPVFFKTGKKPNLFADFPSLRQLTLQDIATRAVKQRDAERLWREIVTDTLRDNQQIVLVVDHPRVIARVGRDLKMLAMRKEAQLNLQGMIG